ncbi:hypothetical protein EII14_01335 [Alloprevotella sp. OH1205_COT-284]|uniref:hypothetical protein n=1 Tax=Alloprevotella sp. OH1205_COT-284 TaxID=2491043 RepID=UPI000F5E442E|nr:hypothetical protein [Alloprevotella sp. OH1205_COT-284]RRD80668.1 hypothetical protein EII14_01335 [Alloprevotella sp. OH1205_COT-284]
MKELKTAFGILLRQDVYWIKKLWRDYTAMAAATALFLTGFIELLVAWIVPVCLSKNDENSWLEIIKSTPFDIGAAIWLAVGTAALIFTAVRSHRKTLSVVAELSAAEPMFGKNKSTWSNAKKTAVITFSLILAGMVSMVTFLPIVVLTLGKIASAQSAFAGDFSPQPWWIFLFEVFFSMGAALLLAYFSLFLRIIFTFNKKP